MKFVFFVLFVLFVAKSFMLPSGFGIQRGLSCRNRLAGRKGSGRDALGLEQVGIG